MLPVLERWQIFSKATTVLMFVYGACHVVCLQLLTRHSEWRIRGYLWLLVVVWNKMKKSWLASQFNLRFVPCPFQAVSANSLYCACIEIGACMYRMRLVDYWPNDFTENEHKLYTELESGRVVGVVFIRVQIAHHYSFSIECNKFHSTNLFGIFMNSLQLLNGLLAPVGVLFCTVFKLCSAATSECMCNWVLFICKLSRVCRMQLFPTRVVCIVLCTEGNAWTCSSYVCRRCLCMLLRLPSFLARRGWSTE